MKTTNTSRAKSAEQLTQMSLTISEYKRMVINGIGVGDEIKAVYMARTEGKRANTKEQRIRRYTVSEFCKNFVVLRDRSGFTTAYSYDDVYKMLRGNIVSCT